MIRFLAVRIVAVLLLMGSAFVDTALAHHNQADIPTVEIAADTTPPRLQANWQTPEAGAYVLQLEIDHIDKAQASVVCLINGETVRTQLKSDRMVIEPSQLNQGVNSITLELHNHDNAQLLWQGKPIQTTLLVDTRQDTIVRHQYVWPAKASEP